MKIVLTGATGFIGRNIIPLFISEGHDVIAVVRNRPYKDVLPEQCRIIEHDIGVNDKSLYPKLGDPDILLHLAWGGLPDYMALSHIDEELPRHYKFICEMVQSGIKHVSVAGTCFEYGMQSGAISENQISNPSNPYGYAKNSLKDQLQFLQEEIMFSLTWMRFFYIYGKNQSDKTLYAQFNKAVKSGQSKFNMSKGEQLRDYIHIDKLASLIVGLVTMKQNIGVVNVCSGEPISVRNLVEQWKKERNSSIKLNLGCYPYPDYEPMAFWGDNSYMNSLLRKKMNNT